MGPVTLQTASAIVVLFAVGFAVLPLIFPAGLKSVRSTTYCYASVKTLSPAMPYAKCFAVDPSGLFSRVFQEDKFSTERRGHVIPGLWDGHGHLLQYGEGIASADLFGASSLHEVRQRLVSYISNHAEAGTRSQWLRGVGWDQANFEGKWPTSRADDTASWSWSKTSIFESFS